MFCDLVFGLVKKGISSPKRQVTGGVTSLNVSCKLRSSMVIREGVVSERRSDGLQFELLGEAGVLYAEAGQQTWTMKLMRAALNAASKTKVSTAQAD